MNSTNHYPSTQNKKMTDQDNINKSIPKEMLIQILSSVPPLYRLHLKEVCQHWIKILQTMNTTRAGILCEYFNHIYFYFSYLQTKMILNVDRDNIFNIKIILDNEDYLRSTLE